MKEARQTMPGDQKDRPVWIRLSGIGMEFAGAVVGFTLLGYWIDQKFESRPTGVLIGAALGIIGGGYKLIRTSLQAAKDADRQSQNREDRES